MWLATKFGFFSVVQNSRSRKRGNKWEPFVVRARVKRDLEILRKQMWPEMRPSAIRIVDTPEADYRYRIEISESEVRDLMLLLAFNVDYPNFKSMIAKTPSQEHKLHGYHEMWHVARFWQTEETAEHYEKTTRKLKTSGPPPSWRGGR
jgi:hypothetical protein